MFFVWRWNYLASAFNVVEKEKNSYFIKVHEISRQMEEKCKIYSDIDWQY